MEFPAFNSNPFLMNTEVIITHKQSRFQERKCRRLPCGENRDSGPVPTLRTAVFRNTVSRSLNREATILAYQEPKTQEATPESAEVALENPLQIENRASEPGSQIQHLQLRIRSLIIPPQNQQCNSNNHRPSVLMEMERAGINTPGPRPYMTVTTFSNPRT